jgi:hypothetical protein
VDNRFFRPLGTLCILASLPMIEAGIPTAHSFVGINTAKWFLAWAGTLGAFVLLTAGIVLCVKRLAGRTLAYCGAALSIVSISFAVLIGLAGGHAFLYGVGYPIVMVLLLRRTTPSDGAHTVKEHVEHMVGGQSSGHQLRSAVA